jgi:S1-C subfamily serine protease
VQPLSPALAAATGAMRGVVVSDVIEGGAASTVLEPGDVITEVDGQAVDAPEALLLRLSARLSAGPAPIAFVRDGEVHRADLIPAAMVHAQAGDALMLRAVPGVGSRIVSVAPASAFDAAGLADTDVIVGVGGARAPSPAQVRRALAQARPGDSLLFTVRRDDRQRVVAVQLPAGD